MTRFESELRNGNFIVSYCPDCKKYVWPPSDYCSICFKSVKWQSASKTGTLLEFSKKEKTIFCMVQFEDTIRVIGTLKPDEDGATLEIGQKLRLDRCFIDNKNKNNFILRTASA